MVFEGEHDFPNLLSSWSNQLHPDDLQPTLDAFANHLNDYTGQTDYKVNYRLRSKKMASIAGTMQAVKRSGTSRASLCG
ncbi:PAS domain-containing protein [Paenibacillus rhizoplanae]